MSNSKKENFITEYWSKLDPKAKKKVGVMLTVIIVIAVALGGYYSSHQNDKQQTTQSKSEDVDITLQPGILQKNINSSVNRKLNKFNKEIQNLKKSGLTQDQIQKISPKTTINNKQQIAQQTRKSQQTTNPAYSVPPPASRYAGGLSPRGTADNGNKLAHEHNIQPKPEVIGEIGVAANSNAPAEMSPAVKKKQKDAGVYLPPSFMQASLLSGLDAPTMNGAKSNPVPVLLRVRAPAFLPNRVRANLRGCFIIADGVGNLASERVMLRLVSLSCIAKDGQAVIDQSIKGFVVGSDGKIGLRGRVVSKMGSILARSALAGFLTGFGNAVQASSATTMASTLGTTSTINPSHVAQTALGGGLSSASKKLSDFYMRLADQTLPVIEIGATRRVTVVLSKGAMLNIKNVCVGGKKCSK